MERQTRVTLYNDKKDSNRLSLGHPAMPAHDQRAGIASLPLPLPLPLLPLPLLPLRRYATTGHWSTFGKKPADEHWVNNAAMAEVRKQLRQQMAVAGGVARPSSAGPARRVSQSTAPLSADELDGQVDLLMDMQAKYAELRCAACSSAWSTHI